MNLIVRLIHAIKDYQSVPSTGYGGFMGRILEPFAGAWQRNIECESPQNILAFSAVYSCVSMISADISKLRIKLVRQLQKDGIWEEITSGSSAFLPVLRKPNHYQTRIQFLMQWIVSKLMQGNTYVLKERDNRKVVTSFYVLDPRYVRPLVADTGDVYYEISRDYLSGVAENMIVPASEIIHDLGPTPWHPLCGLTPISACGASATQGIRIQNNSERFFQNMSRPSGHLTAPGAIQDATAERMKREFQANFGAGNLGKLFVSGDGLKYEPMTIPAADAQLIEQLGWTVADVGRAFNMPAYKLGLQQPTLTSVGQLNQEYYSQTLQILIEAIELLLDEALGLPELGLGTELDLDGLLRMDPLSRAETTAKLIGSGVLAPNEGRRKENLPPVKGGESPLIQQQNYSLEALAKRDAKEDPFASNKPALPAPEPTPAEPKSATAKELADELIAKFQAEARVV